MSSKKTFSSILRQRALSVYNIYDTVIRPVEKEFTRRINTVAPEYHTQIRALEEVLDFMKESSGKIDSIVAEEKEMEILRDEFQSDFAGLATIAANIEVYANDESFVRQVLELAPEMILENATKKLAIEDKLKFVEIAGRITI